MDLKEEEILGKDLAEHWYYKSKANALSHFTKNLSPNHILDIGAGSGFFSKHLLKNTEAEQATCLDIGYDKSWQEEVDLKPIFFTPKKVEKKADTLLFMDVLEHVDDDVGLIKQYLESATEGAYFVFTVPAFQFLWSPHDVFLEHKRRYTLKQLEKSIENSGLEIVKSCYFFSSVFPIAVSTRLGSRIKEVIRPATAKTSLKKHSWLTNTILSKLCHLEIPYMEYNKKAGLSVFAIAKKS